MTAQSLADVLEQRRERVVARFVCQVERKELSPPETSRSLLVDHIPTFIDEIVAELRARERVRFSQDALDTSVTARQHGEQRWTLGYDLAGLVREYGILRHAIFETAKEAECQFTIDDLEILAKCLSVGVSEAVTAYAAFRDVQLDAQKGHLGFLAEAGQVLTSSLDYRSTINRVTTLLVPRLADWCAVHLEGTPIEQMPIAHVDPSKASVLREIYRRFPLPSDATVGYPEVLRTGQPQIVEVIDPQEFQRMAQSEEHLALLRRVNACSWMVVPLQIQGNMFGALTLAYSESGRRYEQADLVLAAELARRAAVAIDNARLYELSQRERSRVEAATRAKDEFVAMISHELRTPLNAILGWVRLIRGGALPESTKEHAFEVIERNAHAQNQLVADLLDISKIMTGRLRIAPSQLDLANVLDIAIEGIRPAAEAKRIEIQADVDRTSTLMRGDGDRLQQVIWNLLANAIKFTPKDGKLEVRLRKLDSDIELVVADTGEGIDPSFLPHVFESFRQSDASATRAHGGLGIGLSIAKHIVELHGGSIEASSEGSGRGSTFKVRLPISALVSTTLGVGRVPATKQDAGAMSLPQGMTGIRVLLVDDEADARELVAYVLEACGMEVRSAPSAAEALAALEHYQPDVIVSDVGMHSEDGYSLIRSIRTLDAESKRSIPAIALTAFSRNTDRRRALVEGFNRHMGKPVEPMALVRAIAELSGHQS